MKNRDFTFDVMPQIQNRWSSRAFDQEKNLSDEDLQAILEAASFAPSCFNEQPWRWVIARQGSDVFDRIVSHLTPGNQAWAPKSDVLVILLSKNTFTLNSQANRFCQFDAGTAWGYLTLEAQNRGVLAHGMGGFDPIGLRKDLKIEDGYDIIALAALGYYGSADYLPEPVQAKEVPSPRRPYEESIYNIHE